MGPFRVVDYGTGVGRRRSGSGRWTHVRVGPDSCRSEANQADDLGDAPSRSFARLDQERMVTVGAQLFKDHIQVACFDDAEELAVGDPTFPSRSSIPLAGFVVQGHTQLQLHGHGAVGLFEPAVPCQGDHCDVEP